MKNSKQFLFYILFAVISVVLNMLIQLTVYNLLTLTGLDLLYISIYKNIDILTFIKMGTATVGAFVFKFFVDKLFIFKDRTENISAGLLQVIIYGLFAVFTTAIFYASQLSFKLLFVFDYSEYIGGALGLTLGYTVKFLLDRKYVFNRKEELLS